jgi:hypothetical protein
MLYCPATSSPVAIRAGSFLISIAAFWFWYWIAGQLPRSSSCDPLADARDDVALPDGHPSADCQPVRRVRSNCALLCRVSPMFWVPAFVEVGVG